MFTWYLCKVVDKDYTIFSPVIRIINAYGELTVLRIYIEVDQLPRLCLDLPGVAWGVG